MGLRRPGKRAALADYRAACEGAYHPLADRRAQRDSADSPGTPDRRPGRAGHTDLAIAGLLHISTRTVQTNLAHIYAKLGINRRADLASHLR